MLENSISPRLEKKGAGYHVPPISRKAIAWHREGKEVHWRRARRHSGITVRHEKAGNRHLPSGFTAVMVVLPPSPQINVQGAGGLLKLRKRFTPSGRVGGLPKRLPYRVWPPDQQYKKTARPDSLMRDYRGVLIFKAIDDHQPI